MDETDREDFEEKANADKARYESEMANYTPPEGTRGGKKATKRKKDPNAPKRPQTAFFVFSAKHREEVKGELGDGARVGDIAKELGKRWKTLDEDARQEYADEAAKQKIAYDKAMEEYREEGAKKPKHASSEDDGHDDDENDY